MSTEQQAVYGVTEAVVDRSSPPTGTSVPLQTMADRWRAWGLKSALALVDQGLFSGAGFLVNLLLARWLAPASYGAFAVAFAAFLFISGFHNVLLLEPLTVIGPGRHSGNLPTYFRAQFVIHFLLVGWLAVAGLLGGIAIWRVTPDSPLVGAIFGSALTLPLLLLLWLVRRMCYVLQRPGLAVAGTASYLVLIIAGLAVLRYFGWATPLLAFLLMGGASLIASGVLLARIGFFRGPQVHGYISWQAALRENWTYGRWLVGSTTLYSVSNQTQTYLVAAMLGLGAAGVLRALQLPSLLMTQAVTAAALLYLPSLSHDFGRGDVKRVRHRAAVVSATLTLIGLVFVALLALIGSSLEHVMYSGKYASQAWLIPMLGLIPVATGFSTGFSLALKAARKPRFDLIAYAVAAPISIVSAFCFVYWWGLPGAAASMILSFVVSGGVTFVNFRRFDWVGE
jgi:O-antigen/teichoic acid export membrane protein